MTDTPQPPVLAPGGIPDPSACPDPTDTPPGPHRQSEISASLQKCAPGRVLPPDHPVRLLAQGIEPALGPDSRALIRAIHCASVAHIKKKKYLHTLVVAALEAMDALDGYTKYPGTLGYRLFREALVFHAAHSSDKPPKAAGDPEAKPKRSRGAGDEVTKMLMGLTLDEVYALAAPALGLPEEGLRTKYAHLNPGMQRMVLGGRMRSAAKKGAPDVKA